MSSHEMNVGGSADFTNTTPIAIAQKLGEQTRKVVFDAQQKAGEQVRSGIDSGKQRAAGALLGVADSLMKGSATEQSGAGPYIRRAGEQVASRSHLSAVPSCSALLPRASSRVRSVPTAHTCHGR